MIDEAHANTTQDSQGIRVFVYGTLKKDHPNHLYLDHKGSEFIGRCYLEGPYNMLDLIGFPGVVRSGNASSDNRIYGEVYKIDMETLHTLDVLEGNGSFYTRDKVTTPWKKAWVYLLPSHFEDEHDQISSGAWKPTTVEQSYIDEQESKRSNGSQDTGT